VLAPFLAPTRRMDWRAFSLYDYNLARL
jgi:hypothetical protein